MNLWFVVSQFRTNHKVLEIVANDFLRVYFNLIFQAISCLMALIYGQVVIPSPPSDCLDHVKQTWPRRGVVRVEVVKSWEAYHEYVELIEKS